MTRPVAGTTTADEATPALRAAATVLWLTGIGLSVAMVLLRLELDRLGVSDRFDTYLFTTVAGVMLAYGALGRFLVARRPGQLVGWIFLATPIGVGIVFGGFTALEWASATGRSEEAFVAWIGLIAPVSLVPTMFLAFPALALFFPDGRLPGPRWRWPVRLLVAAITVGIMAALIQPGQMVPSYAAQPHRPAIPPVPTAAGRDHALAVPDRRRGSAVLGSRAIIVRDPPRGHPTSDGNWHGSWARSCHRRGGGSAVRDRGVTSWIDSSASPSLALLPQRRPSRSCDTTSTTSTGSSVGRSATPS